MFHVKPEIMYLFFRKYTLILFFSLFSIFCLSQKTGDIALGLSLDYAGGSNHNNYASTLHFRYNLFDNFRVAPQFSYYLNKDDMKMKTFAFNFHYLFPKMASTLFPSLNNQNIYFYPLAGFFIAGITESNANCSSCSADTNVNYRTKSENNFGFDFGVGAEYRLPSSSFFFKNASVCFEIQYQLLGMYNRPSFLSGLLYNF